MIHPSGLRCALILAAAAAAAPPTARADDPAPASARSGVDPSGFDKEVRPQDDFFRHVNGGWIQKTEIPPDKSRWGTFDQLIDESDAAIRAIIEEAAKADAPAGSEARKIGDLYTSFMDEARADELGVKPLADDLARVDALADKKALVALLGSLQRQGVGGLFGAGVGVDAKKSDQYVTYMGQGGISLPDESYYREAKYQEIRDQFVAHVEKMLTLAGIPDPKAKAARVLELETAIAKHHWDRVKRRDRTLSYNKKTLAEVEALAPAIDWKTWLENLGAPRLDEVVVAQPDFFAAISKLVEETPLDDWKTWVRWRLIHDASAYLSRPFVDEDFAFFGRTLSGTPELRPRWKRGVGLVSGAMGEAVGKLYVEKHFPPAAKSRMKELVDNLTAAYRANISELDWMSPETRAKALDKLAKFTPKIGYPDKWRDYSKLEIKADDLLGNVRRADAFENDREFAKLGGPIDRDEWGMTPHTVNAYYNSTLNEIVFPAAILQPPFFDLEADDAVNYGAIGAVIGHEIGHGFDDQGSKSDGDGNLVNWWTDADRKEFDARAKKLIEQYDGFEPRQLPGQKVNGALTIGENIGDLGGLTIAYKAYKRSLGGQDAPVIDGLTGDQRFFLGWAQAWRGKIRDAELSRRLAVDPHSPSEFRCNGVLRNLPEFYEAFGVKEGDGLWLPPEKRVRIW
ncbi:M13 family metallopeptidase [Planctomyces sp. SH-PL62]|uniref:M13 family metallopeptidase n=1 Tax=Planctomyces sp. SH-PL62 TaxID=1636152 RepID=UPI00078E458D|nr:M13 family metallopeptidase [Planctomyces sp. SH-PL62]AMV39773.1 Neutral endopeptidase [Planctomyces sp. SH-PL62]